MGGPIREAFGSGGERHRVIPVKDKEFSCIS